MVKGGRASDPGVNTAEIDACFVELRAYILAASVKESKQNKIFSILDRMERLIANNVQPGTPTRSSSASALLNSTIKQPPVAEPVAQCAASARPRKASKVGRMIKRSLMPAMSSSNNGLQGEQRDVVTVDGGPGTEPMRSPRRKASVASKFLTTSPKKPASSSSLSVPFPGVNLHSKDVPNPAGAEDVEEHSSLAEFLVANNKQPQVAADIEAGGILDAMTETIVNYELNLPRSKAQRRLVLFGPDDSESEDFYADVAAARTVSTYPTIPGRGRSGDPICDRFRMSGFESCAIIAVADGCNWGAKPREAAMLASNEVVTHLTKSLPAMKDSLDVAKTLLTAFMQAHKKIMCTKEEVYEPGTTTLLGGVLAPLKKQTAGELRKWAFVCASVGDCKAFYYSNATKTIHEITAGNRGNLTDARDCGGRLGPADPDMGMPDLRNLMLYTSLLQEDDIVFVLSDGVHDNFDPQQLGVPPRAVGLEFDDWKVAEQEDPRGTQRAKSDYLIQGMTKTILAEPQVTARSVTQSLLRQAQKVTDVTKRFMEDNPDTRQPRNYVEYPGKLDHTTCVSVTAKDAPQHPFRDLDTVVTTPEALVALRQFVSEGKPRYVDSRVPGDQRLDDEEMKQMVATDVSFLEAVTVLNHFTRDGKGDSSTYPDLVYQVFCNYLAQSSSNIGVRLDDATRVAVAKNFQDALEPALYSVKRRMRPVFEKFCQTEWMKSGCFLTQVDASFLNAPAPAVPL